MGRTRTELLDQAIIRLVNLPLEEQDRIAIEILADLCSEEEWILLAVRPRPIKIGERPSRKSVAKRSSLKVRHCRTEAAAAEAACLHCNLRRSFYTAPAIRFDRTEARCPPFPLSSTHRTIRNLPCAISLRRHSSRPIRRSRVVLERELVTPARRDRADRVGELRVARRA